MDPQQASGLVVRHGAAKSRRRTERGPPLAAHRQRSRNRIHFGGTRRRIAITLLIEAGDEVDRLAISAVGCPAACEIAECHRPPETLRLSRDVVLVLPRTLGDRSRKAFTRIGDEVLDLRVDAGLYVGEEFATNATARRANTGEVVLVFPDVAALAAFAAELQIVRLDTIW